MRAVSFIGVSGSGKTSLLVELIPFLRPAGVTCVVVKHTHHRIPHALAAPESSGAKDDERFLAAGARVVLVGPDRVVRSSEPVSATEPRFVDVLVGLPPVDLVLVEGWKAERLPSVEVVSANGERVDPAAGGERIAIVGDVAPSDPSPASWARS